MSGWRPGLFTPGLHCALDNHKTNRQLHLTAHRSFCLHMCESHEAFLHICLLLIQMYCSVSSHLFTVIWCSLLHDYFSNKMPWKSNFHWTPLSNDYENNQYSFKFNVTSWWNDLPNSIRAAESLALPSLVDPLTLALSFLILFFKNKY